MSIIFDLDDTLIDTSGSITPQALGWALGKSALDLPLDELLALNAVAQNAKEALHLFLKKYEALNHYGQMCHLICDADMSSIECVPGALDCVQALLPNHRIAIVTIGEENRQKEKLIKAGFDIAWFDRISVVQQKKGAYADLLARWKEKAEKILVVGDKIAHDLQPAKSLGMTTIHMRWGRGRNFSGLKIDVDYTIDTLKEVLKIANEYEN